MTARALVIGINDYPLASGQKQLGGAVADAIDFAQWALEPTGGAVTANDLYFWIHAPVALPPTMALYATPDRPWPREPKPDFSNVPLRSDIVRAASSAALLAADSGVPERLYVFLAGHGVLTVPPGYSADPQSCFVAGDFDAGDAMGLIPLDDLRRAIERTGPAESVLIFDCCRNELPPTIEAPSLDLPKYSPNELNEQWMVGKAAQEKQIAYETTSGQTRGAFTKMLVQALRQYRVDNELTSDALKGFVRAGVKKMVDPKSQVPAITTKHDLVPFVVAQGPVSGDLPELRVSFPPEVAGEIHLLDANDRQLGGAIPITDSQVVMPLEPGQYTFKHPASGASISFFHLGPEPTVETF